MLAKITVEAVVEVSEEAFAALKKMDDEDLKTKLTDSGVGEIKIEKNDDQTLIPDDDWDDEYCDVKKDNEDDNE